MSGGGGGGGMSWIGGMFTAIGSGLSAEGAITGGQAEANALKYNAAVNDINARLARQSADYDVKQIRRIMDKTVGGQTAAYSASGVSADSGSALDVLSETVAQGALNAQRRKFAGDLEAMGLESDAARMRSSAKQVIWNSQMEAFGHKLNGASKVFGSSGGFGGSKSYTYKGSNATFGEGGNYGYDASKGEGWM